MRLYLSFYHSVISIWDIDTCSTVHLLNLLAQVNAIYDLSATVRRERLN